MTTARAPGRVNLIGDHTDYSGGLVCPLAIDLGTTVTIDPGGGHVALRSDADPEPAVVPLDVADPAGVVPAWARYVAGVVAVLRPAAGGRGTVSSTLPVGAGLSSSAALEVAVALALGADPGDPVGVARSCQEAERLASGVPCGIMDQLVSLAGVEGHALLIDCSTLAWRPVPLPAEVDVVVAHSGEARALGTSAYARRRGEVEAAEGALGHPLASARPGDEAAIPDPLLRRRARHVVTENARVSAVAAALEAGDVAGAGALMGESHASLRDDFEVSTPRLDALVARLATAPGVWGARLTGAGFGGCAVALAEPGAVDGLGLERVWVVRASAGAHVRSP
ncbi:MAG TPA: galactokinase [Acidimicrobiales bacterium]